MNRYNGLQIVNKPERVYRTARYPEFPKQVTEIYVLTTSGDRLDLLANKYYSDTRWWWIIARANHIGKGSFALEPGMQLRIPFPVFLGETEQRVDIVNRER